MILGFTGTRTGLTNQQRTTLRHIFRGSGASRLHFGDCKGADAQAAAIARACGLKLECHPPQATTARAYVPSDVEHPVLSYRGRNQAIVDAADALIACPRGYEEELASGTWMTIRMARTAGKPQVIVWPDGQASGGGEISNWD